MPKLGTIQIDGRDFEIEVSEAGDFRTYALGEWYEATSKKALVEKLRKDVRSRARLAIPATKIDFRTRANFEGKDKIEFTQVVLVGVHGRNRNVLYREEGKDKTEQEGYSESFARRLTGEEIQDAYRLYQATVKADAAWEKWREENIVHAQDLITDAVERLDAEQEKEKTSV